jgi:hypothetical protein
MTTTTKFQVQPWKIFLSVFQPRQAQGHVAKPPVKPLATTPTSEVSNMSSKGASSSCSPNIECHRCKGMGHIMKNSWSHHAFIATNNGGYVSASDCEDNLALTANYVADSENEEVAIDPMTAAVGYKFILVQCVLSTTTL